MQTLRRFAIGIGAMLMLSLVQTAPADNASGKDYYVATTGADSNTGTSISKPFKTIQKAASIAKAGERFISAPVLTGKR